MASNTSNRTTGDNFTTVYLKFNGDGNSLIAKQEITLLQEYNESITLHFQIKRLEKSLDFSKYIDIIYPRLDNCEGPNNLANISTAEQLQVIQEYLENKEGTPEVDIWQYHYQINLTFNNFIHSMTDNYGYEVIFQFLTKEELNYKRILTFKDFRKSNEIFYNNEFNKRLFNQEEFKKLKAVTEQNKICTRIKIRRFHIIRDNIIITKGPSDKSPDFSLVVGDAIFPAHKHFLSEKSTVFRAMFSHNMIENQDGMVKICDIKPEVIKEMLSYLYTGNIKNLNKYSYELLEAANKYDLSNLKIKCEEYILFNTDRSNITKTLYFASLHDLHDLRKCAINFIANNERMNIDENFEAVLCYDLRIDTIVSILNICKKYELNNLKSEAYEFFEKHKKNFRIDADFTSICLSQYI